MIEELRDPRRVEPAYVLGERDMLDGWLEFHRTTLLMKCEGLGEAELRVRPIATSLLSLHGLVRHMAEVERGWFQRTLLDQPDLGYVWVYGSAEDDDVYPLDEADWNDDLATWHRECQVSRDVSANLGLDHTGVKDGEPCSLRWILHHMIEEYARHNGHADLIRELVDQSVGA